jgi:hypothetical protein
MLGDKLLESISRMSGLRQCRTGDEQGNTHTKLDNMESFIYYVCARVALGLQTSLDYRESQFPDRVENFV